MLGNTAEYVSEYEDDYMRIIPPEELEEIEIIQNAIMDNVSMEEIESLWSQGDKEGLLELILSRTDLSEEQVLRMMNYAEKSEQQDADDYPDDIELGPDEKWTELSARFADLEEKLEKRELKLAEREAQLAQKESLLEEKIAQREEKLAERVVALEKAEELIQKLEAKIQGIEQRLQTLLDKVETGEYFGPTLDEPVTNSYSLSFDGTATSLIVNDVTENISADLFIKTLAITDVSSKFQVTGGEIHVGDQTYDVAFGKARTSSVGSSGLKDSMILIGQIMDLEGNTNSIKISLNFDNDFESIKELEEVDFKLIESKNKIVDSWDLSGSGKITSLER